jgi:phospholipid/cholesterol/gamma-HCH transport system substrate-binding protein
MSAQANPVRVGTFVIGAIGLLIAGLIAFGSGQVFKKNTRFVSYFSGSVTGLEIGSPVRLGGVPIGKVTEIRVSFDPTQQVFSVPVYFEIVSGSVEGYTAKGRDSVAEVRRLIDRGLRAKLVPQSLVTGQLYVQLAIQENAPLKLHGADPGIIEIPSLPSDIEVITTQLGELFGSPERKEGLKTLINNFSELLNEENRGKVSQILDHFNDFSASLARAGPSLEETSANAARVGAHADQVMSGVGDLVAETSHLVERLQKLTDTVAAKDGTADQIGRTARSMQRLSDEINAAVSENRPGIKDFTDTTLPAVDGLVLDLERLAAKLNRIADNLERDPSAFLFGPPKRGVHTP